MRKCMTANEIADGLAQMHIEKDVNGLFNKRIQNMLRQQQAEIKELKTKLQLHEAMDNQCAFLMQQFRKAQEK